MYRIHIQFDKKLKEQVIPTKLLTYILEDSLAGPLIVEALDLFLDITALLLGVLNLLALLNRDRPTDLFVRRLTLLLSDGPGELLGDEGAFLLRHIEAVLLGNLTPM